MGITVSQSKATFYLIPEIQSKSRASQIYGYVISFSCYDLYAPAMHCERARELEEKRHGDVRTVCGISFVALVTLEPKLYGRCFVEAHAQLNNWGT